MLSLLGSGLATAVCFADEGARVVIADVREASQEVSQLVKRGAQAVFIQVDVSNEPQVAALIEKTVATFGRFVMLQMEKEFCLGNKDTPRLVGVKNLEQSCIIRYNQGQCVYHCQVILGTVTMHIKFASRLYKLLSSPQFTNEEKTRQAGLLRLYVYYPLPFKLRRHQINGPT